MPPVVFKALSTHFYGGVKRAEISFHYHHGDEDAVTGGLGERLIERGTVIQVGGQAFGWRTEYFKLRGRGNDAPEKTLGADGIFQLEVSDQQMRVLVRKGLLFQAKIKWTQRNKKLLEQAQLLKGQSTSSIVIDYSEKEYRAIDAAEVVIAEGRRKKVRPEYDKPLAQVLGDEFIGCLRGDHGLYWDREAERLVVNHEPAPDLVPSHFIGTTLQRLE
ncbi:MAG: hypothetical protein ABSG41_28765 [Bryobacteraceae bacterium]